MHSTFSIVSLPFLSLFRTLFKVFFRFDSQHEAARADTVTTSIQTRETSTFGRLTPRLRSVPTPLSPSGTSRERNTYRNGIFEAERKGERKNRANEAELERLPTPWPRPSFLK